MGYRSEVAFVLSEEGYQLMCYMLERQPQEVINDVVSLLDDMKYIENDNDYTFYKPWIKWYSEFPEVAFIESVFELCNERDILYSFMRIGEEFGDLEESSRREEDLEASLYLTRSIAIVTED